jgi:hypothetical protein
MKSRQVAIGDSTTLEARRDNALAKLQKVGASEQMVLAKLERPSVAQITVDDLMILFGAFHAIKEGDATVEELFYVKNEADDSKAVSTAGVADLKEKLAATTSRKKTNGDPPPFDQASLEKEVDAATTTDALELLLDKARALPDEPRKAIGNKIAVKVAALAAAATPTTKSKK